MNKTQAVELPNTICDLEKDLCKLSTVPLMAEIMSEVHLESRNNKRNMIIMELNILKLQKMIFTFLFCEL